MNRLIFAFMAATGRSAAQALILTRSIRAFAGEFSDNPIWVLTPQSEDRLSREAREKLVSLDARVTAFRIDQSAWRFPFAGKVIAAAAAESLAWGQADFLAWMDSRSIVINQPDGLLLGDGKSLGYRPVDHTLIGSPYGSPVDPFWASIYRRCGVPEGRLFPMTTSVDEQSIRPYFNAGLLVVRPGGGLLQQWRDSFSRLYRQSCYKEYYERDVLYQIFIHQAVLAGAILSALGRQELQQLSHLINYPLHMHAQYPAERRPNCMNDLISCRYEAFFDDPGWSEALEVEEPLKGWLLEQFAAGTTDRGRRQ